MLSVAGWFGNQMMEAICDHTVETDNQRRGSWVRCCSHWCMFGKRRRIFYRSCVFSKSEDEWRERVGRRVGSSVARSFFGTHLFLPRPVVTSFFSSPPINHHLDASLKLLFAAPLVSADSTTTLASSSRRAAASSSSSARTADNKSFGIPFYESLKVAGISCTRPRLPVPGRHIIARLAESPFPS